MFDPSESISTLQDLANPAISPESTDTYGLQVEPPGTATAETPLIEMDIQNSNLVQAWNLDIDGDGEIHALSDGIMVLRYLWGSEFDGDTLTHGAIGRNATRTAGEIRDYLNQGLHLGALDLDGDGTVTASSDGVMVLRHLFGSVFAGEALTHGAISPQATRTADQIREHVTRLKDLNGSTVEPPLAGRGLTAEYFNGTDFEELVLERVDSRIDFNWRTGSPDESVDENNFSVRWSGMVEAEFSETYTFSTISDDGVRLWVNGELLIDSWQNQSPKERSGEITLEAGQLYDIKLEYFEKGGLALSQLSWESESQSKEVIPASAFYQKNDLVGTFLNVTSESLEFGDKIQIDFQVANLKSGYAPEFDVGFYLSKGGESFYLGSQSMSALGGNAESGFQTVEFTLPDPSDDFWSGDDGVYRVWMLLDEQEAVREVNEQNNIQQGEEIDIVSPNRVDLKPVYFNIIDEPLEFGDTFEAEFQIENAEITAAEQFEVSFKLFNGESYLELGRDSFFGLPGNAVSDPLTMTLTLPDRESDFWIQGGTYTLEMFVDSENTVSETNELNNWGQGLFIDSDTVQISDPYEVNLQGLYFDVLQEPLTKGDSFDIDFQIQNSGKTDVSDVEVRFVISSDAIIDGSDYVLGSQTVSQLAGFGVSDLATVQFTLPDVGDSFWGEGSEYWIGLIIDPQNLIEETQTADNASISLFVDFDRLIVNEPLIDDSPDIEPPIQYDFPTANQPVIGVIDTGLTAINLDLDFERITLGYDYVDGDANPLLAEGEGDQHGTHITGVIGATQGNGIGIDGGNDDAPLWISRAIASGQWAKALTDFVNYAKASNQPNAIANLSFDLTQTDSEGNVSTRYELTPEERTALEYARQNNVLLVVAAGNTSDVMSALGQSSQEFDNIITVGSLNQWGIGSTSVSSYGLGLDLLANGGTERDPILATVGDGLGTMYGTSVAAAQVTSAASLVWAANPGLSYRQVKEALISTARDLPGEEGWGRTTGFGALQKDEAIAKAQNMTPEVYDPADFSTPTTWSGEGTLDAGERAAQTKDFGYMSGQKRYQVSGWLDNNNPIDRVEFTVLSTTYFQFSLGLTGSNNYAGEARLYRVGSSSPLARTFWDSGANAYYASVGHPDGGGIAPGDYYIEVDKRSLLSVNSYDLKLNFNNAAPSSLPTYYVFPEKSSSSGGSGGSSDTSIDLTINNFDTEKVGSGAFTLGDYVNVYFQVENDRGGDPSYFDTGIYLSKDNQITTSDELLGSFRINSGDLGGNDTTNIFGVTVTLPDFTNGFIANSGEYYIGVLADHYNRISETSESNNAALQKIWIELPDVIRVDPRFNDAYGDNFWLGDPVDISVNLGNSTFQQKFEHGYLIWNGQHATAYEYGIGRDGDQDAGITGGYLKYSELELEQIDVTTPNIKLTETQTYEIKWSDDISEDVKIELYKGNRFVKTISSLTASDGSYRWAPPTSLSTADDYRFKVSSINDSSVYGYSSYFGIKPDQFELSISEVYATPERSQTYYKGQLHIETGSGYKLRFQGDGNLVIYNTSGTAIWATGSENMNADRVVFQGDGNIVMYDTSDKPIWATNTNTNHQGEFRFQDDGNLVVYNSNGQSVFATNTEGGNQTGIRTAAYDWQNPSPLGLKATSDKLKELQDGTLIGQYKDMDNAYGYQCWDLVAHVAEIDSSSSYWLTTSWKRGVNVIDNNRVAVGSIIATFKGTDNSYLGHTAVFGGYDEQDNVSGFWVWSQNFPTGSGISKHFIPTNGSSSVNNDADDYYVVTV